MNLSENSITYDESNYNLIKNRIMTKGEIVEKILDAMEPNNSGGTYKAEILKVLKFSDTAITPVLTALYCTGFIDMRKRGTTATYFMNEYSKRLLNELKGSESNA